MTDGQRLVFAGEGDHTPGLPPGDLILVIDEETHPHFKRKGSDLLYNLVWLQFLAVSRNCKNCNHYDNSNDDDD